MSTTLEVIDVRTIDPSVRHAQLFDRFDGMLPGEAFVIVSDHNPIPLRRQLEGRTPGEVEWTYLQEGPEWRVQIGRQEACEDPDSDCCSGGACG